MSSTLDRLTTRSASAHQVNLANLRASRAISSASSRLPNTRPPGVGSANPTASFLSQKSSTLGSQRTSSARRIRNMLDLESVRNIPTPTPARSIDQRLLDINPAG